MTTDSLQKVTTSNRLLGGLGIRVRQLLCGVHGHDHLLHFEQGRISLQCVSCGHQSPGWEVKEASQRPPAPARPASGARILRLPSGHRRHVA